MIAVGGGGTILRYDGDRWRPKESGTQSSLNAVHGTHREDVFAVGEDATILHFDGKRWLLAQVTLDEPPDLDGVWASPEGDVVAVGDKGLILRGFR